MLSRSKVKVNTRSREDKGRISTSAVCFSGLPDRGTCTSGRRIIPGKLPEHLLPKLRALLCSVDFAVCLFFPSHLDNVFLLHTHHPKSTDSLQGRSEARSRSSHEIHALGPPVPGGGRCRWYLRRRRRASVRSGQGQVTDCGEGRVFGRH